MDPVERPALLVIDMENEIVKGKLAFPAAETMFPPMIANCRRLIDAARARHAPVIYSRIAFRPGYVDASPHAPVITVPALQGLLLVDTWGTEIVDELKPLPQEVVITKKRTSAFFGSELDIILRGYKARSLIITGTATNRAVEGTARDAHAMDYDVYVVSDATAPQKQEFHEPSLRSMNDFIAHVCTTDEALKALGS